MVKASSQIEKELRLLQQRTEDMASALDPLYDGYLKALGEASQQQLMAAAYHLCTQAYPDKFLCLSWQQRNQLQKDLQVLAAQVYTQLSDQREQVKKSSRKPQRNNGLAFLQKLLEARASGAVIHTKEGSSDDLLDKLSEIARFEPRSDDPEKNKTGSAADDHLAIEEADAENADIDDSAQADDWQNEGLLKGDNLSNVDRPNQKNASEEEDELSTADFESFSLGAEEELAEIMAAGGAIEGGGQINSGDDADDEALDLEVEVPAAEQRLTISEEEDLLSALEALARRSSQEEEQNGEEQTLAPSHLMKQKVLMEQAIQDVFKTVSEEANRLLQKADVMPSFPKALMAAAADTRGIGEPMNAVPNVVKVSVRVMRGGDNFDIGEDDDGDQQEEREGDRQHRDRKSGSRWQNPSRRRSQGRQSPPRGSRNGTPKDNRNRPQSYRSRDDWDGRDKDSRSDERWQNSFEDGSRHQREGLPGRMIPADAVEIDAFPEFAVINLQLSEVEFTDPRVSVWRSRLRKELANLKQLGLRYRKTQKSLEVAKAEDAWRASWTSLEDS